MLAGGPVDPVLPPGFVGNGGWLRGAVPCELSVGNGRCSNDDRGRNCGRSRIWPRIRANHKPFVGKHFRRTVSFSPEGETGHWLLKVAAYLQCVIDPRYCEDLLVGSGRGHGRGLLLSTFLYETTRR
jgi:hypothetical protein